ncbi:hypothetical protein GN958_ATG11065 [Phytophthora infestans]|uniref:Uncharacterized protein n=1 Tax=Phytophthora infestans TaxID=4787 RepID=A0A8S9ULE1_PHYIN|nr:hypothetical protein GN958_ATG10995 [Phytophthora infestans]KAF4139824.1 hypothetical protein GN958_ATG11065 [Phytophthora infestans]
MSTPTLSIPYMRVKFAEATVLTYTNPKLWRCLKISDCSYWHRTNTVYWKNLAYQHYAIFYESDECNTDDKYFFASDIGNPAGGEYTFKKNQVFQSMTLGKYDDKPFKHVNNCPSDKENTVVNETGVLLTWANDGLSTNWTNSLP